ncbi:MAG: SDR family oxidoreductase [Sporichthyaceae bacterium]
MTGTLVITGASRGIGAATARKAAAAGWDVCIGFRKDRAAAEQVAADCTSHGVAAMVACVDVAVELDVLDLFEQAEQLGPIRALVNNAGVIAERTPLVNIESDRLEDMFGVNVFGAFFCAREAVRVMLRDGEGGSIVNVSSRSAVLGGANAYIDYAASKAAVDTLTIGLAAEVAGAGIRVNAVRPGIIDTEIHSGGGPDAAAALAERATTIPLRRLGTPDEVAGAILWLLSGEASYVTGTILDVSGGR